MAEEGFNTPVAILSLKDYAELTGKKDLKELRTGKCYTKVV